ncbi:hypothetical protein PCE1_001943 [Barthelona sp. PCE]
MVHITIELLRKRSEHNDKVLYNLKEITLHQQHLHCIDKVLQRMCPELEWLYLQSNTIRKFENLRRLKRLKVLNISVNQLVRFEGMQTLESLEKLDVTANLIDDLLSAETLFNCYNLSDITMIGNPCTKYEDYRLYLIKTLPQLLVIDGVDITPPERQIAQTRGEDIVANIVRAQEERIAAGVFGSRPAWMDEEYEEDIGYVEPEGRKMGGDDIMDKGEKEVRRMKSETRQRIRSNPNAQCNEGKLDFRMFECDETGEECLQGSHFMLEVHTGKYLSMNFVDCEVYSDRVEVEVKGHLLRLLYGEEVDAAGANATMLSAVGKLRILAPKKNDVKVVSVRASIAPKRVPSNSTTVKRVKKHADEVLDFEKEYMQTIETKGELDSFSDVDSDLDLETDDEEMPGLI